VLEYRDEIRPQAGDAASCRAHQLGVAQEECAQVCKDEPVKKQQPKGGGCTTMSAKKYISKQVTTKPKCEVVSSRSQAPF
jgi:hypothetical protein